MDPEAAQRVFAEGFDTTMVGLDVTHRALITDAHTERMRSAGRVGKVVAELMDFMRVSTRSGIRISMARRCTIPSASPT